MDKDAIVTQFNQYARAALDGTLSNEECNSFAAHIKQHAKLLRAEVPNFEEQCYDIADALLLQAANLILDQMLLSANKLN